MDAFKYSFILNGLVLRKLSVVYIYEIKDMFTVLIRHSHLKGRTIIKKRIVGLDAIKLIACIGVVFLHVGAIPFIFEQGYSNALNLLPSQFIYYLGTISVPLFFMTNGYFLINRQNMNYLYIFKKIVAILIPVFLWNLLYWVFKVIKDGTTENVFVLTLKSLVQKGYFFQFWFMGSLLLLLLLVPIFNFLMKSRQKTYFVITLGFLLICFVLDSYNHFSNKQPIQSGIIQTFRLWTWCFYYLLGGLIGNKKFGKQIKYIFEKIKGSYLTILLTILVPLYCMYNKTRFADAYAEFNYDNLFVIIWISFVFVAILFWKPNYTISKSVITFSSASMGVYIVHASILKIVNHFIDLRTPINNVLGIIIVLLLSFVLVLIMKKVPFVNKLVAL